MDKSFLPSLMYLRNLAEAEEEEESHQGWSGDSSGVSELDSLEMAFTVDSCTGQSHRLQSPSSHDRVTKDNLPQYIAQAIHYR